MKIKMPKLTATQALQVSLLWSMFISWMDMRSLEDYGVASLYILGIIVARWFGNATTATVAILFATSAEVYTNAYLGLYAKAMARGSGYGVMVWGILLHIVGYSAVVLTIRWILGVLDRERHVNQELFKIMREVRELESLLPICSYCKQIRDDAGQWQKLETYIADHTGTSFTHGCCPDCKARELAEFKATQKP